MHIHYHCRLVRKISLEHRGKKSKKTLKMQNHSSYQRCAKEKQFSVLHAFKKPFRDNDRIILGY